MSWRICFFLLGKMFFLLRVFSVFNLETYVSELETKIPKFGTYILNSETRNSPRGKKIFFP